MFAYKDLLELAGLTTRLYTLLTALHGVTVKGNVREREQTEEGAVVLEHVDVCIPEAADEVDENGQIQENGESNGVGVHPQAPPLVKDLSLVLKDGDHLMITGSNGVGKTAVARVLAGLWAPRGKDAALWRPKDEDGHEQTQRGTADDDSSTHANIGQKGTKRRKRKAVFVVPQRSYMVAGSLLDQMIYPDSYVEYVEKGWTEDEMHEILESVFLGYLPEREGGFGVRKEWRDVLSGGEKQRVGF